MIEQLGALYGRYLWRQFEKTTHRPEATQLGLLQAILKKNERTAFGVEHGFRSIRTVAEYQKAVPIRKYSALSPWVDRVAAGEKAVLTQEPVVFFNMSSGTSGKPKLIPVTKSWMKETARLRMIWGTRTSRAHPALMSGKTISIVYAGNCGETTGGIPYGSLSGQVFLHSPAALRRRYALPYEIARINDPESKQYAAMRLAVVQNVTFLFSTNPATIISMVETAERRQEELIRDIHDGTLSANLTLPEGVREGLAPYCKADPQAAHALEAMAKQRGGKLRPMDYWPDCAVFGCWLGSTVGIPARHLPEWFGPSLILRDVGLAASEGVFTLPLEDNQPYGPLTVDTNFYEFIPVEEADQDQPPVLTAGQLTEGREYVLILTSAAGLYRYNINDVVRVVGKFNETPMLEFVRKGDDSSNLVGEKMDITHLIQALETAQKESGIAVQHFRVQADAEQWLYRYHVELHGAPSGARERLLPALEKGLLAANFNYAKWIKEKQLRPVEVCVMKPGWFERYVNDAMAHGARHGQFKPSLLTRKPEPEHEKLDTA